MPGVMTAVNPGGICALCLECKHSKMSSWPARITSYQLSTRQFSCEQTEKSSCCVYIVMSGQLIGCDAARLSVSEVRKKQSLSDVAFGRN